MENTNNCKEESHQKFMNSSNNNVQSSNVIQCEELRKEYNRLNKDFCGPDNKYTHNQLCNPAYILHKMYPQFEHIQLHKNENINLNIQDEIWQKICKEKGLHF
jgi:hypothetical protein